MSFLFQDSSSPILASRYTQDDAGRIYLQRHPVQGIPRSVRYEVVPPAGWQLVAADWKSAHLRIATRWSGDTLLQSHDIMARELGVTRTQAKVGALAFINGAGPERIRAITGREDSYTRLHTLLPGIVQMRAQAQDWQKAPGSTFAAPSLAGAVRLVEKDPGPGGWRRLLSALWTRTEADALYWVLHRLPRDTILAVPLFDGILIGCPEGRADIVAEQLQETMAEGAWQAGVEIGVTVGWGRSWGEAEGLPPPMPRPPPSSPAPPPTIIPIHRSTV